MLAHPPKSFIGKNHTRPPNTPAIAPSSVSRPSMSAWGKGGTARSCDALLRKVEQDDPRLQELVILSSKTFSATDVERLCKVIENGTNAHLISLSASGHTISPPMLQRLGTALSRGKSKITSLAIGDKDMGDDGVCALCDGLAGNCGESACDDGKHTLENVDLSWKGFGAKGMQRIIATLGKSSSLKALNLSRNEGIGARGSFASIADVHAVGCFGNLQELDLSECNLNVKSCAGLASIMQSQPSSSSSLSQRSLKLRLDNNPSIQSDGMDSIASLIPTSSITELHLENCQIGDEGLRSLADRCFADASAKCISSLRVLHVGSNGITSAGLESFIDKLETIAGHCHQLDDLILSNNAFDEQSVQRLATTLNKLRGEDRLKLSKLDLTGTQCGVTGARDMIEHGQLRELVLFNNQLGSDGLAQLAPMLRGGHRTLEVLDVGGNDADESGVVRLLEGMMQDADEAFESKLRLLVVGGNKSGLDVEDAAKRLKAKLPGIDVARDKPKKDGDEGGGGRGGAGGGMQFPPGFTQQRMMSE